MNFRRSYQATTPQSQGCRSDSHSSEAMTDSILSSGRRDGLMVSALDSGSSGPGSSAGLGHCVVFLGTTLYSHSASLHPGNLRWSIILSWGSSNIPSCFMLRKPKFGLSGFSDHWSGLASRVGWVGGGYLTFLLGVPLTCWQYKDIPSWRLKRFNSPKRVKFPLLPISLRAFSCRLRAG